MWIITITTMWELRGNRGGTGMQNRQGKVERRFLPSKKPQKNYWLPGTLTDRHWKACVYSFINTLTHIFLHTYSDSDVLTGCRNALTDGIA